MSFSNFYFVGGDEKLLNIECNSVVPISKTARANFFRKRRIAVERSFNLLDKLVGNPMLRVNLANYLYLQDIKIYASIPIEWFYPTYCDDSLVYNDDDFTSFFTDKLEKNITCIKGLVLQIPPLPSIEFAEKTIISCNSLLKKYNLPILVQGVSNILCTSEDEIISFIYSLQKLLPDLNITMVDSELITKLSSKGHALVKLDGMEFPSTMDLNDDRFSFGKLPIVSNCPCYACIHHSRAYIHHLLNTKEMLAQILLLLYELFFLIIATIFIFSNVPCQSNKLYFLN